MSSSIKFLFIMLCMVFIAITMENCANQTQESRGNNIMSEKTIEEVLKEHTDALMAIDGVVGVAQGLCDGKECVKVYVVEMTSDLQKKIPAKLDGYPVDIEVTGEFKALPRK